MKGVEALVIIVEKWKWKWEDGPLREKERRRRRWNSEAEAKEVAHGMSAPQSQWQFGNRLDISELLFYFIFCLFY